MARVRMSLPARLMAFALLVASLGLSPAVQAGPPAQNGLARVASAHPMAETIARLKQDIADKGIMFFAEIDQSKLAADAGIALRPSTLLIFGNPPLGSQFMTSSPESGIDWPVRLLVIQDERGLVSVVYNDFAWVAQRHGIADREQQFGMASTVIASIVSSVSGE